MASPESDQETTTQVLKEILTSGDAALINKVLPDGQIVLSAPRDKFTETTIRILGESLTNLAYWKELASKDRRGYHEELDNALSTIKAMINWHCGIQAQRPRQNADRDKLIVDLKTPQRSFGQVAKQYTTQTGKKISAKLVERICKRQQAYAKMIQRAFSLGFTGGNLQRLIAGFPTVRYKVSQPR